MLKSGGKNMKKNTNKIAEFLVKTCATCPFIKHDCINGVSGFYCDYNHRWLPHNFNILEDVYDECVLEDVKMGVEK